MNDKFANRMNEQKVTHDVRILGDFVQIFCDAHHQDRARTTASTDGAILGVYGRKTPVVCDECLAHLAYAEKRRAYCPKDPKPFCAHCDTHCYRDEERVWQQRMMHFSGPKSWRKGHAMDGIRHMIEAHKHHRQTARVDAD